MSPAREGVFLLPAKICFMDSCSPRSPRIASNPRRYAASWRGKVSGDQLSDMPTLVADAPLRVDAVEKVCGWSAGPSAECRGGQVRAGSGRRQDARREHRENISSAFETRSRDDFGLLLALMYGPAARCKRDHQDRICGLAPMYQALHWSSWLRAIMDMCAQPI